MLTDILKVNRRRSTSADKHRSFVSKVHSLTTVYTEAFEERKGKRFGEGRNDPLYDFPKV